MSETDLILAGQQAVSDANWSVGQAAYEWTFHFARGRTDADFGELVGMSGDQVYQRRRAWESFGPNRTTFPRLRWSHFYVALNWEDAPDCLAWANENGATVAEMKAWRRLQQPNPAHAFCDEEIDDGPTPNDLPLVTEPIPISTHKKPNTLFDMTDTPYSR